MVFANEAEINKIKPQSPIKMKRNTGMNQWVLFSIFEIKNLIFRLFPIFEQIQALRNAQAALKAKRDGGLDALMDSIYQDVSFSVLKCHGPWLMDGPLLNWSLVTGTPYLRQSLNRIRRINKIF